MTAGVTGPSAGGCRTASPATGVLSEEGNTRVPQQEWAWVLDPLDGTTNFTYGIPHWTISLALLYRGRPMMGWLEIPPLRQRIIVVRGEGVERNGRRLQPPTHGVTPNACASLCTRSMVVLQRRPDHQFPCKLRMFGVASTNMASVALGQSLGALEASPKLWDLAAAWLVLEELGCPVEPLAGPSLSRQTRRPTGNGGLSPAGCCCPVTLSPLSSLGRCSVPPTPTTAGLMSRAGCQAVPDVLFELLQALARDGGDPMAGLVEVLGQCGGQVFQLADFDGITLVESQQAWTIQQCGIVGCQLPKQHGSIPAGIFRCGIQQVNQETGALDVAQEIMSQASTPGGTLDEAGNIGKHRAIPRWPPHHSQVGRQRGERVVRHLGARCGEGADQGALARVGTTHQPHFRQELEFQP